MESTTDEIRRSLYEEILRETDHAAEMTDEALYRKIDEKIRSGTETRQLSLNEKLKLRETVFASLRRLDILSLATDDPEITEIMVNGTEHIFIEKNGKLEAFEEHFSSPEKLNDVIQKIASQVNRRINEATPMVDARLPDGSRVNAVLPPVAIDGPAVTIRRFPKENVTMEKLIGWGSITEEAAEFLRKMVVCGYNIFISGGTGAGKTTFLGALAGFIPPDERVITIEDSAELRLTGIRNLVRLESRPANLEGRYGITIRDLIRNALRMRPDRIIVGEIRSAEALDMLQAMNTGHDGSLSTGHANSAQDMIARIETMVLMGMDLPLAAIRSQIASGIDILVHLSRLRDRTRRVTGIYEITGIGNGEVMTAPLFEFTEEGMHDGKIAGKLKRTDHKFTRTAKLIARGMEL